MIKHYECKHLVMNFKFEGTFKQGENHVCGHINDTHILDFEQEDGTIRKYILQRINTDIFTNPEELMSNMNAVTKHIAKKIELENGNPLRETLNIVEAVDGKIYYKSPEGDYFRGFVFIEGAKTYMMVEKPEDFYKCGKAIGKFQHQLSDFDVEKLYETIPDFHNTAKRYEVFLKAVKEDKANRVKDVASEIDFIMTRGEETRILVNLLNEGHLPVRVTHNDTKFNNIMIDDVTGEGIAVIDLDTVMPGLSLYDFGDSIRSGATTAEEDETDLSKVNFDINLYKEFTKGYLESVGKSLTKTEIEYLAFSAKLITLELGMRFLTDHLNGDVYFKVHRENHNLDRARNQFKLAMDMEENMEVMKEVVKEYIAI